MITREEYERMKKESIETAKEMQLINDTIVEMLENVPIEISDEQRPKSIGFGQAFYLPLKIKIYRDNIPEKLPGKFAKIFTQVGMDHEIIGHLGNYLMLKDFSEVGACRTEYQMAKYRSKKKKGIEGLAWKFASYISPIYQKFVRRKIKLKDYRSSCSS